MGSSIALISIIALYHMHTHSRVFQRPVKEAEDKYAEEDVAVVFGASHFGKDGVFEFGVLHR